MRYNQSLAVMKTVEKYFDTLGELKCWGWRWSTWLIWLRGLNLMLCFGCRRRIGTGLLISSNRTVLDTSAGKWSSEDRYSFISYACRLLNSLSFIVDSPVVGRIDWLIDAHFGISLCYDLSIYQIAEALSLITYLEEEFDEHTGLRIHLPENFRMDLILFDENSQLFRPMPGFRGKLQLVLWYSLSPYGVCFQWKIPLKYRCPIMLLVSSVVQGESVQPAAESDGQ